MYNHTIKKYSGRRQILTTTSVCLLFFDLSKQSEKLKSSVVDVQIRAIFNEAVPAGTQAYAVVISDKLLTFQSDGSKMYVVY